MQLVLSAGGVLLSVLSRNPVLMALAVTGFLLLNAKAVPEKSRWAAICCTAGALFGGMWGSSVALSMVPGILQLRGTLVTRSHGRRLYLLCAAAQGVVLWWARHDEASLMLGATVLSYVLISSIYQTSKEVRAVTAAVCLSQIAFMYGQGAAPVLLIVGVTALLLPLRLSKRRRNLR
jgi:hypothetical protein